MRRPRAGVADRPAGTDALTALRDFILSSPHEKSELDHKLGRVIAADPTLSSHQRARIAQLQEVLAPRSRTTSASAG